MLALSPCPAQYEARRLNPVVISVDVTIPPEAGRNWSVPFLVTSDRHIDSPMTHWSLQKRHLEEARARNARVLDLGDMFDAMQGRDDPRRNNSDKKVGLDCERDEPYFDALVTHAERRLSPYADLFLMLAEGNHESNVRKRHEKDLIQHLVERMNFRHGANCFHGDYEGYIKLNFIWNKTKRGRQLIRYHHGSGGNARVTHGVIDANRRAVFVADADVLISGHNHKEWSLATAVERVNQNGVVRQHKVYHVNVPSYKAKDPMQRRRGSYETEKEFAPSPVGAYWLEFRCIYDQIECRPIPA